MKPATVRLLTAPATGAIAVLELRGPPEVLQSLVAAHVDRPVPWRVGVVAHRVWRDAAGRALDDGLVVLRADDCVELHLHGGRGVVAAVVESLRVAGVEMMADDANPDVSWRGTVERALAEARTARLAKLLIGQREVAPQWVARAHSANGEEAAEQLLAELRAGEQLARFIEDEPPAVVLAGRPNAGKSTLFNALLGGDRALVSPHAGTTRDTVEAVIAVRGLPVRLVDTAGLTEVALAEDRLERRGQVRSLRALRGADLVLHVVDLTADEEETGTMASDVPVLRVGTKADLCVEVEATHGPQPVGMGVEGGGMSEVSSHPIRVSAVRDPELRQLLESIADALQLPEDESIVPVPLGGLRQRLVREPASASDSLRVLALLLPEAKW